MTVDQRASRDVLDLITGAWRTQVVYLAVKLTLPDRIQAGATTSRALAESAGTDEDFMHRLMRLLVSLGVFEGDAHSGYRNTPVSLLLRDVPGSLRDMCLLYGEEFYTAWGCVYDALTSKRSGFEEAFGRSFLSYLTKVEGSAVRFQRAMVASSFFFEFVPTVFEFAPDSRVVDIGGGSGQLLGAVLKATPGASGVLVDLAHMIPVAKEQLARTVGLDRVELVEQDALECVPPGGDVYLLSRVLGDWDDESCVRLLRNCREAMSESARLLVIERATTDEGTAVLAALWDMHLHVVTKGRQRTMDEFHQLFHRVGLRVEEVRELPLETTALVVAP